MSRQQNLLPSLERSWRVKKVTSISEELGGCGDMVTYIYRVVLCA